MINILDVIILLLIAFGAISGFKRGAIKSSVSFIGIILVIIVAYILKNPLANFMMKHLPFFDFGGTFKGVSVLNILIYEAIAFCILFAFLQTILQIIIHFSSILESILKATIVLSIPSKILGLIFGFLEGFIYAFVLIYVLSLFSFSQNLFQNSKLASPILNHTIVLTNFSKKTSQSMEEIYSLKEKYQAINDKREYNYEAMDILLKYDVVSVDTMQKLVEQGKLELNNVDVLVNKYS